MGGKGMSFRDIRSARASRKSKSFVASSVASTKDEAAKNSPQAQDTQDTTKDVLREHSLESLSGPSHQGFQDASLLEIPQGWYAELPPFLSVRSTKERGRGLWTSTVIPAGSVVFFLKPHIHALSRSKLDSFCSLCCALSPVIGLKKCTRCRTIFYCGTACQNTDWASHKLECEALQRWASSAPADADNSKYAIPPEAVRCLARILWRRKRLGSSSIWWNEINEMQSHRSNLAQSMVDAHVHLAHALVRYMGISGQEDLQNYNIHSIGELVDLISKFTSNTFTLTTASLSPIGVSVSPAAALVNHSCDPNVAIVFPRSSEEEPMLQVIAIKDIPIGSELFTSYIDITLPTSQRQADLKETYNFACNCNLCTLLPSSGAEDWRERMWCPKKCGGTCPIPTSENELVRCSKCRSTLTDPSDVLDLIRIGKEALEKATRLQFTDPECTLRLTENMIPLMTSRFPPSAHPLLALLRLRQGLLIASLAQNTSQAQLDEAISVSTANISGLLHVLLPGHPVRAIALAELGKLLAVDEPVDEAKSKPDTQHPRGVLRLQRSLQTLQQAYGELCTAFGNANGGGEVGKSVHDMLVDLEKELSVWRSGIRDALNDALSEHRGKSVTSL